MPLLILVFRDRAARSRRSRAQTADQQSHDRRLLNPDWSKVEQHLQRPVPPALRELYADRALITRRDLRWSDDQTISAFEPLDDEAILEATATFGFAVVPIATTDFGDLVYLRPGAAEDDVVCVTYHDGGDTEVFADSVTPMLARLRTANRPD